jgi:hypothetical protein
MKDLNRVMSLKQLLTTRELLMEIRDGDLFFGSCPSEKLRQTIRAKVASHINEIDKIINNKF